jgi:hypothetical protein
LQANYKLHSARSASEADDVIPDEDAAYFAGRLDLP